MTHPSVYISGMGIISPIGNNLPQTLSHVKAGTARLSLLNLFPTHQSLKMPAGEIHDLQENGEISRTHHLARIAADETMKNQTKKIDAVVLGSTTGGMLKTEKNLKENITEHLPYQYHSPASVTEYISERFNCKGPAITISTACSSGAAAIKIAFEMIRSGKFHRILAGGVDSLCKLTYHGFNALKLIDPKGARPFDIKRNGMSVGEGAAFILLDTEQGPDPEKNVEILGGALSCDAFHLTAPHPQGKGALDAMRAALKSAGVIESQIDYVNLHGTGTIDNDHSESMAVNALFPENKPPVSSVKGATGHSLGASGAIESVISVACIHQKLVPGNSGLNIPDPELNIYPVINPVNMPVQTVMSNSFGFGGNNASLIFGTSKKAKKSIQADKPSFLSILGSSCITAAGNIEQSYQRLEDGKNLMGMLPTREISLSLSNKKLRRLKRLPRLTLSLAMSALENMEKIEQPTSVFFGTGFGPLSETYDFLSQLYRTEEYFSSPTDFIGSVHNAPAGHVAIQFNATGPNVTTTGKDYSFEQTLFVAEQISTENKNPFFAIGADEFHQPFTSLLDKSVLMDKVPSDGGGALVLKRTKNPDYPTISCIFFESLYNNPLAVFSLINRLGGRKKIRSRYGALLVGIPGSFKKIGKKLLNTFYMQTDFKKPIIEYRKFTGEYPTASAVATVLGKQFLQYQRLPRIFFEKKAFQIKQKRILIIGISDYLTAIEIISH